MVSTAKNNKLFLNSCKSSVETDNVVQTKKNDSLRSSSKRNNVAEADALCRNVKNKQLTGQENLEFKQQTFSGVTIRKRRGRKFGTEITNAGIENALIPNGLNKSVIKFDDVSPNNLNVLATSAPITFRVRKDGPSCSNVITLPGLSDRSKVISPLCQTSTATREHKAHLQSRVTEEAAKKPVESNVATKRKRRSEPRGKRTKTKLSTNDSSEADDQNETSSCSGAGVSLSHSQSKNQDAKEYQLFGNDSLEEQDEELTFEAPPKPKRKLPNRNAGRPAKDDNHSDHEDRTPPRRQYGKQKAKAAAKKTANVKVTNDDKALRELMKMQEMEDIFNNYSLIVD